MWLGDKVYFLSDRNGSDTLFAYYRRAVTERDGNVYCEADPADSSTPPAPSAAPDSQHGSIDDHG